MARQALLQPVAWLPLTLLTLAQTAPPMNGLANNPCVAEVDRWSKNRPEPTMVVQSLADWAAQIRETFAQGRANTLELARLVWAAKRRLLFGQWTQLWKSGQLPFAKRKGEMLVVIGQGLADVDAHSCAHLPMASWTLYYLAQLDRLVLTQLVVEKVIHPALTVQEARDLLARHKPQSCSGGSRGSPVKRRLSRFRQFVQDTLGDWTQRERETAQLVLQQLAVDLAGGKAVPAHEPRIGARTLWAARFESAIRVEKAAASLPAALTLSRGAHPHREAEETKLHFPSTNSRSGLLSGPLPLSQLAPQPSLSVL